MSAAGRLRRALERRPLAVVRAALAAAVLAGVLAVVFYALFRPSPENTFDVFYAAAAASREGHVVYHTRHGQYVYTPVVLYLFYPYLLVDLPTALLVHRLVSVAAALAYGVALARFLDQRVGLAPVDRLLVVAFVGVSLYPVVIVVLGGVEVFMGALLGLGFVALEIDREEWGGALWAAAALVKVFPALWGAYLLRRRAWRAVGAALLTGVGATLVGVVSFGADAYVRYVRSATSDRVRLEMFAGGASPDNEAVTPVRPLAQLFPNVDPQVWPPVIFVVVALLVLGVYLLTPADRLDDRAALLLATVVGVTFVMPTSQDLDMYLVYGPLVVLLYAERDAPVRAGYAIGTVVLAYNFSQGELGAVAGAAGPTVERVVLAVADPVLTFASMPLYGLFVLFGVTLVRAYRRGVDADRVAAVRRAVGG